MSLAAVGPVEDDVRGGDEFDAHDAGVHRVFAKMVTPPKSANTLSTIPQQ
jgi:hypothetical protein